MSNNEQKEIERRESQCLSRQRVIEGNQTGWETKKKEEGSIASTILQYHTILYAGVLLQRIFFDVRKALFLEAAFMASHYGITHQRNNFYLSLIFCNSCFTLVDGNSYFGQTTSMQIYMLLIFITCICVETVFLEFSKGLFKSLPYVKWNASHLCY